MRIVVLAEAYPKNMGYAGTQLPKALAKLGADVHYVTAGLPAYTMMADFKESYGRFPAGLEPGIKKEQYEGYTVHFLPHRIQLGYVRMLGLFEKLREIKTDIVQTFSPISWGPLQAALIQRRLGYGLFTGNHTTASVFPLAQRRSHPWERERIKNVLTREICGRFVSLFTQRCYAATTDCAYVAKTFLGVPQNKIDVLPLGVDTDIFSPAVCTKAIQERADVRKELGFAPDDIVCIYTGRFAADKNPLLLAQAIERLGAKAKPFRCLFVGDGVQAETIARCARSVVRAFVPFFELAKYYRAADIGVWPTQESTSMLDAAACGLPIIVNDTLRAVERIEGNGAQYKLNDLQDLVRVLERFEDPCLRRDLGNSGANKMATHFSWRALAQRRLTDYEGFLRSRGGHR